jgi:hypothetical protein
MRGGAAVGRGISGMGRATIDSVGRGYQGFQGSAPVVSTAKMMKKQKLNVKMEFGTIISIIFLLAFYISVSALGINILNKCSLTDESKKLQNIKGYYSHTLAMAIGVVTTLLVLQIFKGRAELSAFFVIFALMGAVGSYMMINVINECDPADKKAKVTYAGISAAVNTLMLLVCLFMLFRGKKVVENSYMAQTPALTRQVASVGLTP